MIKYLIFLIFAICIIDSSFAEPCLNDTLFFVDGMPVYKEFKVDLDGNNKVENVFDWYTVEPYDNDKRKQVEESFRDFPAHIFLGAISFSARRSSS